MLRKLLSSWVPEPSELVVPEHFPQPPRAHVVAFGLAHLGVGVFGLFWGLALERHPVLAFLALVALAPRVSAAVRPWPVARAPLAAALALVPVVALAWCGAVAALEAPLGGKAEGGSGAWLLAWIVAAVAWAFAAVPVVGALVARERPRVERALAVAARAAVACSVVLVAVAGWLALARPAAEDLAARAPVVAVLPPVPEFWYDGTREQTAWRRGPRSQPEIERSGLVFRTRMDGSREFQRLDVAPRDQGATSGRRNGTVVHRGDVVTVRRDRARGLVALVVGDQRALYRARGGALVRAGRADVADLVAPPLAWSVGAAAGVALAALAWARLRRVRAVYARPDGWRAATVGDGGWIRFADGTPPRLAAGAVASYRGPLVVVPRAAGGAASYRDDGGLREGWVVAGTREQLALAVRTATATADAFALAVALAGAGPLALALAEGLVAGR